MPSPSAYEVISTQLPKWWNSLRNKQDFTVADAVDVVLPHSISDAAAMVMTGGLGKAVNTGLGAIAASTYSPHAEGGVLGPRLSALHKLEQMLWKAKPPSAPKPILNAESKNGVGIIRTPTGDASLIFYKHPEPLPKAVTDMYPDAMPFTLDTSMLQGKGEDLYRSLYANLGDTNYVQLGGPLSQINRGRKPIAMANALTMDNAPINHVMYSQNMNLAGDTTAPMVKALLPSGTPLDITPEEFARLGREDQLAILRINQMMGAEDAIAKYAPNFMSRWQEPVTLMPRNTGALTQLRINQELLDSAKNRLASRSSVNPDFISKMTPEQLALEERANVLSAAYGQKSIDHAKFLMDGLILPEKYHQSLVDDYVRQLSETAVAPAVTFRSTPDAPARLIPRKRTLLPDTIE